MKYLPVSWEKLHKMVVAMSKKIKKSREKFDLIVAIARGGLSISHILSDYIELPIASFTISSYKDLKQNQEPKIILKLGNDLSNKKILLVDDVSDTGKTFIHGIKYLKKLNANSIKTASPFVKPHTKFMPDYYVSQVSEWIIFPYDKQETKKAFKKLAMSKDKISSILGL